MIIKVIIDRAEGPHELLGSWTFEGATAEAQANAKLEEISLTAPDCGGYDKTDVAIFLDTGDVIGSRHDIKYKNIDGTIREHAEESLSYYAEGKSAFMKKHHPELQEESTRKLAALRAG